MAKKYLFDKRGSLISEIQEIARTHSLHVILSDENIQYSVNSSTQVEPIEEPSTGSGSGSGSGSGE